MKLPVLASSLILLAAAPNLGAQEITGRVTSGGVPLPAVVITMLDSSGATVARALTYNNGRYRLPPTTRAASVRATRIGFRPVAVRVTSPSQVVDIAMVPLPTMLSAVQVIDQPGCPRRRDRAEALALWEQARAAFLSTVVARETDTVSLERLLFYRIVGEKRAGVLAQVVRRDTGGSRPFGASRSARQFVELGFRNANTGTYFAPDADVLLDEAFTRSYCIRLAGRDASRPRQVGIRFEPAARKRDRIDIDGTVWVDTAARAVRDIEFRYRGLNRQLTSMELGGNVAFTTLPKGYPAVTRWSMRVDAPMALMAWGVDHQVPLVRPGLLEVHELGGELARASWSDTTWTATLGRVTGRVLHDSIPAAGATLHLVGTPFVTRTDSAGNYSMDGLLPGRYTFAVPHDELNALGFELTSGQSFESDRDVIRADVTLPTAADFLAVKCRIPPRDTVSIMIAGRVFADGALAPQTRVNLYMATEVAFAGAPRRNIVLSPGTTLNRVDTSGVVWDRIHHDFTGAQGMFYLATDGPTGASGAFFICKPPRFSLLRIDAEQDTVRGTTRFTTSALRKRIYPIRVTVENGKRN
ncbi:MAG TPA: carboxypeptidase-like regulatory domain-containing protein [Gemmatimonadaceae bacterium]|nr:carboxypeptidase-like regulatory domain-containing protein [Gemmatimonadaceae bacterium]